MIQYLVSDLIKEVKIVLDRNDESDEVIDSKWLDTLTQGKLIDELLLKGIRTIEQLAPAELVEGVTDISPKVTWSSNNNGNLVGRLEIPANVMRVLFVKASDWSRPAKIISDTDDEYAWQSNMYVCGNTQNPIAALTRKGQKKILELYTSKSESATVDLSYVILPSYTTEGDYKYVTFSRLLEDAVVYMVASLVCDSLGDSETSASLKAIAYQFAGIQEQTQS